MRWEEVVVIGGGVAGATAALAARAEGATVTLLEEQSAVGGYMRWCIGVQADVFDDGEGRRGFELAELLWDKLYDAGVNVQLRSTAWGLFEDNVLGVVNPDTSYQLRAEKIVLASGSTDVAIPFAGWELPGVMTARAALTAMNIWRVVPGRRVGVVGNGSDLQEVLESLSAAGVDVVAHVSDVVLAEAGGEGSVEWLSGNGERAEVDAIITVHGVQPDAELALQGQAGTYFSDGSAAHVPQRSDGLESSVKNLWVVGDAAGITTTLEAAAEGNVAGHAVSKSKKLDAALERLAEVRTSAGVRPPASIMDAGSLRDETQVCRCEEIRASEVRQAIAGGATTINDVKRKNRAGMGVCQGIFCTRSIATLIHSQAGTSFEDLVPMTARPPARLIPLARLAASED